MKLKNLFLFLILLIAVSFVIGCVSQQQTKAPETSPVPSAEKTQPAQTEQPSKKITEQITDEKARIIKTTDVGLGTLCTGEDECVSFCHNNMGRCKEYCTINKENNLCKIIFPVEPLHLCSGRKEFFNTSPIVLHLAQSLFKIGVVG